MAAYPMPACGVSVEDTDPYPILDVKVTRMASRPYGVINGPIKDGWFLGHGMCTWAEILALKASFATNFALSGGTPVTFVWPADGTTKTVYWVGPPKYKPVSGMWWSVKSPLEE